MAVYRLFLKFYGCFYMVKVIERLHVWNMTQRLETLKQFRQKMWLKYIDCNIPLYMNSRWYTWISLKMEWIISQLPIFIMVCLISLDLIHFVYFLQMKTMLSFNDSKLSTRMLWSWINMTTSTISQYHSWTTKAMQTGNIPNESNK